MIAFPSLITQPLIHLLPTRDVLLHSQLTETFIFWDLNEDDTLNESSAPGMDGISTTKTARVRRLVLLFHPTNNAFCIRTATLSIKK